MGRAKLKARAAQRYVPAATPAADEQAEQQIQELEFLPLEPLRWLQGAQRQEQTAASPKTQPCQVEAPAQAECWSQLPVEDANSKSEADKGKAGSVQIVGDELDVDDSAQYVYCLPRVILRRPDGVVVNVMAAALAGGEQAEASLHLKGNQRSIDPLHPVLYLDVHGGRVRLEGRLVTTPTAHIATLSTSKGVKGEESEVRLRERIPGVVVFHRLKWLGSVDDNPKEEASAFPDSIEVELPLDNIAAVAAERLAEETTAQQLKCQRHEGDDHQVEGGANASDCKTKMQTATVGNSDEQCPPEMPAKPEVDTASDEPAATRPLVPSPEAAESVMAPPQDAALVPDESTLASTPAMSPEHNGQRVEAVTGPTSVEEASSECLFGQSDFADSESASSSSRSPSPVRTQPRRRRRHKFGTNDSDEDPDWTETMDLSSAKESDVESEPSSSALSSSSSSVLSMSKAKRRKRRKNEDAPPPPSTETKTPPHPSKRPMPSASANSPAAAKRRRESSPRAVSHDDEVIVLESDSDDEDGEDDDDDDGHAARHRPVKGSRRGVDAAPSESDDSIVFVGVVEAPPVASCTPSRPASQGGGRRGAVEWFAESKASVESEVDEEGIEAVVRSPWRAARKRARVLDSDDEQQEEKRSGRVGGGSDDDDELVDQVLTTGRRAVG